MGVDLNWLHAGDARDTDSGGGFGLRGGEEWEVLILTLSPELSAQYSRFGGEREPSAYQLMGGTRLGIGFIIEPSVFAHAGIGYLDQELYGSGTGFAYDVGAALDLTLIPFMDIGVHAQLSGVNTPADDVRGLAWLVTGVHVEFEGD